MHELLITSLHVIAFAFIYSVMAAMTGALCHVFAYLSSGDKADSEVVGYFAFLWPLFLPLMLAAIVLFIPIFIGVTLYDFLVKLIDRVFK